MQPFPTENILLLKTASFPFVVPVVGRDSRAPLTD
jgi:hypothetical protein